MKKSRPTIKRAEKSSRLMVISSRNILFFDCLSFVEIIVYSLWYVCLYGIDRYIKGDVYYITAFIVRIFLVGIDGAVGIGSTTGCIGDSYGNHFVGGFRHIKPTDFDNPLSAV